MKTVLKHTLASAVVTSALFCSSAHAATGDPLSTIAPEKAGFFRDCR